MPGWSSLSTPGARSTAPTSGGFAAGMTMGAQGGMGGSAAMGSGGTGAAANTSMSWGHDTHARWQEPESERDPSRSFYHERRSEGRRHTPVNIAIRATSPQAGEWRSVIKRPGSKTERFYGNGEHSGMARDTWAERTKTQVHKARQPGQGMIQ